MAENMVVMGRIVAPYGVFGWLKVIPDTEHIDGLFDYVLWSVGKHDQWREMKVESAKVHNDVLVVKLAGINDRDAALALKGQQVAVPRINLPKPADNEYYWSDLIGLRVKNTQGVDFGEIVDVFETGANDVIVVRADQVKSDLPADELTTNKKLKKHKVEKVEEKLLPFITSVVLEVDLSTKSVLVDWDADF